MTDAVLILDFGSQVTQLIARRLRERGVYSEIRPFFDAGSAIAALKPKALILSGGPESVIVDESPAAPEAVFRAGLPVLGICYGQQTMVARLGGGVIPHDHREFGRAEIEIVGDSPLFDGLSGGDGLRVVWMSHGDRVDALPDGFTPIARSAGAPYAAIADEARRFYGVQFHPEVVHTPRGADLLANFALRIAGCAGDWSMAAYRAQTIDAVRAQVGPGGRVVCGLSGGVDSAVTAALIHEAIGDRLTCIFVDTGLMRAGEADDVVETFRGRFNMPLIHRDASGRFFAALNGVTDPERKRKAIGELFIDVFDAEAHRLADGGAPASFLAQGTLYPDVVESVSVLGGPSATIKSHHNVGGLPERMRMALVEPLRALFKDEVRALGRELGLPDAIIGRHPFPGPGLAIRIPGPVDRERADRLRKADAIYSEEIRAAGLYDEIWQAFAALLPVRSVGVMGDARSYDEVIALRAVTSTDGMTADFYPLPHDVLGRIATRIVNEVAGVNRVVYDVTSKPPGTIEWE